MTLINGIVILLAVLPIIGVITDIKSGKIKNFFIFPFLIGIILLSFQIVGFYQEVNNLIQITIMVALGYIFYIYNKWGAGDGKYIITLGYSLIIIGYLKGIENITLLFVSLTFLCISVYVIIEIWIQNRHIPIIKNKKEPIKIDLFSTFYNFIFIFICANIIHLIYSGEYKYLIIFLTIFIALEFYKIIQKYTIINIILTIIAIGITIYLDIYIGFFISLCVFFLFSYIGEYIGKKLDTIDIIEIEITHLKQGNILTPSSIQEINNKTGLGIVGAPLQGEEVFKIIKYYKTQNALHTFIKIYKDIKVGIYIYIAYVATIIISITNL